MKKENLSMIIYLFGAVIEIILLLYVKSFKTGQVIHLSNYIKYFGVFFPQIVGAVGAFYSRYAKISVLWLFLNLSLILSALYFYASFIEVIG